MFHNTLVKPKIFARVQKYDIVKYVLNIRLILWGPGPDMEHIKQLFSKLRNENNKTIYI